MASRARQPAAPPAPRAARRSAPSGTQDHLARRRIPGASRAGARRVPSRPTLPETRAVARAVPARTGREPANRPHAPRRSCRGPSRAVGSPRAGPRPRAGALPLPLAAPSLSAAPFRDTSCPWERCPQAIAHTERTLSESESETRPLPARWPSLLLGQPGTAPRGVTSPSPNVSRVKDREEGTPDAPARACQPRARAPHAPSWVARRRHHRAKRPKSSLNAPARSRAVADRLWLYQRHHAPDPTRCVLC